MTTHPNLHNNINLLKNYYYRNVILNDRFYKNEIVIMGLTSVFFEKDLCYRLKAFKLDALDLICVTEGFLDILTISTVRGSFLNNV